MGENPLGIVSFWPAKHAKPPMLQEFWLNRFQWGIVAKHSIKPENYYFADSLTATQMAALLEDVDGKNRLAAEQTLISNLYLYLGERGQERLHKRRPHLKLGEARYPRVLYAMEGEFEKERNETYEVFQLLSRKQRIEESLEQLHAVLSGLAAR